MLFLASQAGTAIQNLQLPHDSKEQATHDSLTVLLSHSTTLMALTQELMSDERNHQPLGVLIADLDYFNRSTIPMAPLAIPSSRNCKAPPRNRAP
jgi:GGDEF domain-containing protein